MLEEGPDQGDVGLLSLTPAQAERREMLARIGDATHRLPAWLARPSQSPLNTLKWYARQGQLHRLIAGEAAYRQATDQIALWRSANMNALIQGDPSLARPYEQTEHGIRMLDKSLENLTSFGSFESPIRNRLRELIEAGDDEGAAQ